ncbi:MAG: fatty acid desaturase [Kouleothrix sp.]|jgi:omega-6 fatty acid desaturase (delta-12 desaturase)|nr:fatty acid desaturase [Kouleothrix sp.]
MQDPPKGTAAKRTNWQEIVAKYQTPKLSSSLWQVANTLIPYFILLYAMYLSLGVSYWLTLVLALPAGGLLTRIFILFHDCGHGSFFKTPRANNILGMICGVLVFTPYFQWRFEHAIHHATSGDLDRRGTGDITTLTIKEYLALSRWGRLKYRLYRSPVVLLGIGPWYTFLISQRLVNPISRRRERLSVYFTNLTIVAIVLVAWATIGIGPYLLIQLPVAFIAGLGGIWMFYIQHQFEGTYWAEHTEWDYATAALRGSSYFKLPKVLQWFTGNIGFHHIHHLSSRIPNYALQRCMEENPEFMDVTTITLRSSLKSLRLNLWDEERRKLVSFGYMKQFRQQQRVT